MNASRENPFPPSDVDRYAIWEMLVERDTLAFIAEDWSKIAEDFHEDGFFGIAGPSNPDHWRIRYDTLDAYREDWLRTSQEYSEVELVGADKTNFLFEATVLRDIEIRGDYALAHKKFDGSAIATNGKQIILRWQTVYHLRRREGRWLIAGFTGYLPNPMPDIQGGVGEGSFSQPRGVSQHITAGPYSPVLRVESSKLVVISGQGPINDKGEIVGETIEEQTHLTMQNCIRQLASGGASLTDVFRVTVYLADMQEWQAFNQIYKVYLSEPYPARTAVQCVLWGGIRVEIEMWAVGR